MTEETSRGLSGWLRRAPAPLAGLVFGVLMSVVLVALDHVYGDVDRTGALIRLVVMSATYTVLLWWSRRRELSRSTRSTSNGGLR